MSTTIQKTKELQKKEAKTTFIVCDDEESTRTLIEAESIDEAVDKAEKEEGLKPHYVIEERLATSVVGREKKDSVEE